MWVPWRVTPISWVKFTPLKPIGFSAIYRGGPPWTKQIRSQKSHPKKNIQATTFRDQHSGYLENGPGLNMQFPIENGDIAFACICYHSLEPQTTIHKWLFQLDDSSYQRVTPSRPTSLSLFAIFPFSSLKKMFGVLSVIIRPASCFCKLETRSCKHGVFAHNFRLKGKHVTPPSLLTWLAGKFQPWMKMYLL